MLAADGGGGAPPLEINSPDDMRASASAFLAAGDDITDLGSLGTPGSDLSSGMPHSSVGATGGAIDTALSILLSVESTWPTETGGNLLSSLSLITGVDEDAAAGLQQVDMA